jgi:hypothetical protein
MNQPNAPAPAAQPAPAAPAEPKDHELRDPPDESVAGEEDPGSGLEQFVDALHQPQPPERGQDSRDPYGPGGAPPSGADSGQRSAAEGDTSAPSTSSK